MSNDFLIRMYEAELKKKAIIEQNSKEFDKREKQKIKDKEIMEKRLKEMLGYSNPMKEEK